VATVSGPSKNILLGERPALNMLARASGIASRAKSLVLVKEKLNWNGVVAATRKTTPGSPVKSLDYISNVFDHK
jgi:nicotinate-nucleotide pyrophosphorylase (carboxylating)